jgi:hypothetical protein
VPDDAGAGAFLLAAPWAAALCLAGFCANAGAGASANANASARRFVT